MKRKWIVSSILVFMSVLFALLKDVFSASIYISLSFLILLSAYWTVEFIVGYIFSFHKKFEERFEMYLVYLINSSELTSEDIQMGRESLKKKFKKSLRREKLIEIGKILVAVTIMITTIVILIRQ